MDGEGQHKNVFFFFFKCWDRAYSYLVDGVKWQPTPVFLPGKFHGQSSLVGYSPSGRKESYMTERLHSLGI